MRRLTNRQREALWLCAQGLTAEAIGRRLQPPCSGPGAQDLIHKSIVALDARNATNAVFKALTLGVLGPYLNCGSRKAYLRHIRANEQSCIACRKANTAFVQAQRNEAENTKEQTKDTADCIIPRLSPRQTDALKALQNGATKAPEVARLLGINDNAARSLVNGIMNRFRIDNMTYARPVSYKQAVDKGIELGYLPADPEGPTPPLSPHHIQLLAAVHDEPPIPVIIRRTGMGKRSIRTLFNEICKILDVPSVTSKTGASLNTSIMRTAAYEKACDLGLLT